jgi:transposase-like protein
LSVRKSLILAPAHTFSPKLLSIKNIPNPRQSLTLISLIIGKVETTKMKTFLSHKEKKTFSASSTSQAARTPSEREK